MNKSNQPASSLSTTGERQDMRLILQSLFEHSVAAVNPYRLVREQLLLRGKQLRLVVPEKDVRLNLTDWPTIYLCAIGKAALPMAQAVIDMLGNKISDGIIVSKVAARAAIGNIGIHNGGHPIPNLSSQRAAESVIRLAAQADQKTLMINLISGGASALCSAPYHHQDYPLTLEDLQQITSLLLATNATINEVNCVRKHLSALKGGRFLQLASPATTINLVLSDVIGDDLGSIASGLVAADKTSYHDALHILAKYRIKERAPSSVMAFLQAGAAGEIAETPTSRDLPSPGHTTRLIGNNMRALEAVSQKALTYGFTPQIITSHLRGNARQAAEWIWALATHAAHYAKESTLPLLLIIGGETTVEIRGKGMGGRNQELALTFLTLLDSSSIPLPAKRAVYLLSAATDGNDGPTDAAGAFADRAVLQQVQHQTLDMMQFLNNNDSYHFHEYCGSLLRSGATHTNVCDMQLLVIV